MPRGRPRLKEEERRSEPVGVRLTKRLRTLLEEARQESGASLSQEIALRLWQSFTAQEGMDKRFGGAKTAALLERIANCIRAIEVSAGADHHWLDNRFVFDQVQVMLNIVLDHFKPRGRLTTPRLWRLLNPALRKDFENMGRRQAFTMLAMLKIAAGEENMPTEVPPVELKHAADLLAGQIRGTPLVEYEAHAEKLNSAVSRASSKRRTHR